jgi:hypothetical protein
LCRAPGQLDHVIEHHQFFLRQSCLSVIPPQRGGESLVERDAAKELGVALYSVKAVVDRRNHRGDHFVMAALQRQIR